MNTAKQISVVFLLAAIFSGCTTTNTVRTPDKMALSLLASPGDSITVYTQSGEKHTLQILEFQEDQIISRPANIKYNDIKKAKVTKPSKAKSRALIICGEMIAIFFTFF